MCIIRNTIEERKESMATGKALDGKPYAGNPHVRFDEGEVAPAATPRRGSLLYSKVKAATAALTAAFAATPLAAANGGGDQFIISGDPVAAETVGSSSDSSATSALESGTLADGVVLESAFETRYCTWYDSPARSLRSDECRGMIISFR